MLFPDYIFESSWEVCNKVGGIYTVLSTRAKTMESRLNDHVFFLGPDLGEAASSLYFKEDTSLFSDWVKQFQKDSLRIRIGRWLVPGNPIAILIDYKSLFAIKDSLYGKLWELYQVDSLHACGDYDDSVLFSIACGMVVESFFNTYIKKGKKVVFHANEWQTGVAALYLNHTVPQIATIFTTHATSIGRSIAGNNKPLYNYLSGYNGDQMADELNVQSKHSVEKQTAWHVDCFTTVSDITARECEALLDKPVDIVLPNGFEGDFVPVKTSFSRKRNKARNKFFQVANALTGCKVDPKNTLILSTSGRYEFRNKGIDEFIESINKLRNDKGLSKNILAFIEVPGWEEGPRKDLAERLESNESFDTPLPDPFITHNIHNFNEDRALGMIRYLGITNAQDEKVKIILVPSYLLGNDGIFNLSYYDLILGNDLCIYPSYYEPWGYTPLEAVAFKVPCITTDLSGFGLWANKESKNGQSRIEDGVEVVHRTDDNYFDVAESIKNTIVKYSAMSKKEADSCRQNAETLAEKALWKYFFKYYEEAYDYALRKSSNR